MKAILRLDNPIWKTAERQAILDKAVQASGAELEAEIKQVILSSIPGGKTYRRGAIRRRIAKRDLEFFRSNRKIFKRKFTSLYRETTVVGYSFHRASAPGQAPAVDSGGLLNSIRAKKRGMMRVRVSVGKKYGAVLDGGATINNRNKRTRIAGPFRNRTIAPRPFLKLQPNTTKQSLKKTSCD